MASIDIYMDEPDEIEEQEDDPAALFLPPADAAAVAEDVIHAGAERVLAFSDDEGPDIDLSDDDDEPLDEYFADEEDADGDSSLPEIVVKPAKHPPYDNPTPAPPPLPRNPKFWTHSGHFIPDPGVMTPEEEQLRIDWAYWDLYRHNVPYILELCKSIRHDTVCRLAEQKIRVGCRNYIVELEFDDGVRWLLKIQQPTHEWSEFQPSASLLAREIASMEYARNTAPGIPIPTIHAWNVAETYHKGNPFGKPFYIMSKVEDGVTYHSLLNQYLKKKPHKVPGFESSIMTQLATFTWQFLQKPSFCYGEITLLPSAYKWRQNPYPPATPDVRKSERISAIQNTIQIDRFIFSKHTGPMPSNSRLHRQTRAHLSTTYKDLVKDLKHKTNIPEGYTAHDLDTESNLLKIIHKCIKKIFALKYTTDHISKFYYTHGDLTGGNILVDPKTEEICSIIDWECASSTLFLTAMCAPELHVDDFDRFDRVINSGKEDPHFAYNKWLHQADYDYKRRQEFIEKIELCEIEEQERTNSRSRYYTGELRMMFRRWEAFSYVVAVVTEDRLRKMTTAMSRRLLVLYLIKRLLQCELVTDAELEEED